MNHLWNAGTAWPIVAHGEHSSWMPCNQDQASQNQVQDPALESLADGGDWASITRIFPSVEASLALGLS